MAPPGKWARRYVVSLYREEADAMRVYGHGVLSRGIRKAWRARTKTSRRILESLVEGAIEADDLGECVTEHLAAIKRHLDGSPKPTRFDSPSDGLGCPESDDL